MGAEWRQVPLSELTDPDTPVTYGVVKPGPEDPNGVLFIRGGDIAGGRVLVDQLRTITREVSQQYRRTQLRGGEIVVSLVGNPGQVAIVPESLNGANIARQAGLVRLKSGFDTRFVKYFLSSPKGQEALGAHSLGSVQQVINLRDLKVVPVPAPTFEEQRAIAHILGTLDDKIELNRRRNQTLEAMARALFKDWFVDFGPVRAKMEGRAPYLPADLWQLFPDRLDNEGKPEGWIQQRVGDIGSIICGKTPSTKSPEYYGDDVPFITIPEMHGNIFATDIRRRLSHKGAKSQAQKLLPPGSICVSCIATLGLVIITTEPSQTNQQINSVIPAKRNETYFWYWALKNLGEQIKAGGSGGSVLGNLSTGRFSELQVDASIESLRLVYNARVENLYAQILTNELETQSLAQLRNTLLPKLISGDLRIADAETFMKRVGI